MGQRGQSGQLVPVACWPDVLHPQMLEVNPGVKEAAEEECPPPPSQATVVETSEPFSVGYRPKTEGSAKTNPGKGVQTGQGIRSQ